MDRDTIFISHATPHDNDFVRWLCERLTARGYVVWADVFHLKGGTPFWTSIEEVLRKRAVKVIFVVSSHSIDADRSGVRNELSVADGLRKSLKDPEFIVPLRIDDTPFDEMPIQIHQLNTLDFSRNWDVRLPDLLDTLEYAMVPRTGGEPIALPGTAPTSAISAVAFNKLAGDPKQQFFADEERTRSDAAVESATRLAEEHRARPVRAYRVRPAGEGNAAPRFQPGLPDKPALAVLLTNLPQQVTPLIGREMELVEIKALLAVQRLVTLVGAGGVGKTRVSLQVGADVLERNPDGVWLAELAPFTDPQLVAETVAGLFGVSIATDRSPVDTLVGILKHKRMLLILDNCEHLVATVARFAETVISSCPGVHILASSREPLGITGESTYRLPSLSFPSVSEGINAESALNYGAVRLFVDRARAIVPEFTITDDNAPTVAAICKRLDGVAFAIQLAAPRLKMLKLEELANRLQDVFQIMTRGSRTALPRHQTLKALIDWSYDLLSDAERTLLRRLAVFAGGWTLDSAAAVTAGKPVYEEDIVDLIASLIDKSLVIADATGRETRYRMLETTRQYALKKVVENGERNRQHQLAEHLVFFYTSAEAAWPTAPTETWLATYAPELDNLRASLAWAFGPKGNVPLGLELTSHSLRILHELSLIPELKRWFDFAIVRIDEVTPAATAGRLWLGKAFTYVQFNDRAAADPALRAASFYQQTGDPGGQAAALTRAGGSLMTSGKTDESEPLLRQAHDLLRTTGATKHLASCLQTIGIRHLFGGDATAGREFIEAAVTMSRALGDSSGLRIILNSRAEVQFAMRDVEGAVATISEVIAEALRHNDRRTLAHTRMNLAAYLLARGAIAEARVAALESLPDTRSLGLSYDVTTVIEHLAVVAAEMGQVEQAARLLGYAVAWYDSKGTTRQATEQVGYDRLTALLSEALPALTRSRLLAEGGAWTEDHAADEALRV
jgi:predicted ATPase